MLTLAKHAIESSFPELKKSLRQPANREWNRIPSKLRKKRACFVTLTIKGQLRGCIGHILPIQTLYRDIIENAKAAAFDDPRFPPLEKEELDNLTIELSILDIPKPFSYQSNEEFIAYLLKYKPGVILSKGPYKGTFLPQVWDDLPDPIAFLSNLSLKAGLEEHAWKHGVKIELYDVEKIYPPLSSIAPGITPSRLSLDELGTSKKGITA